MNEISESTKLMLRSEDIDSAWVGLEICRNKNLDISLMAEIEYFMEIRNMVEFWYFSNQKVISKISLLKVFNKLSNVSYNYKGFYPPEIVIKLDGLNIEFRKQVKY